MVISFALYRAVSKLHKHEARECSGVPFITARECPARVKVRCQWAHGPFSRLTVV